MVRLNPQWSDSSKPGNDRNGYIRGYKGVDREDNSEWFRTADRAADDFMYGKAVRNRRPDGAQLHYDRRIRSWHHYQ